MSVQDLARKDSIVCRVIRRDQNGCFLSIIGVDESPIVWLFDVDMQIGSVVLASIRKISEDRKYIKVCLDSALYSDDQILAA
jgi:hypothetical protein